MPLLASDRTIEWLSNELRDHLVGRLARRGGRRADAEDAVQSAILTLVARRDPVPATEEGDTTRRMRRLRLGNWVSLVASRLLARAAHSRRHEVDTQRARPSSVPNPVGDGSWLDGYVVRELLDRVPESDREVLVMRAVGYDIPEMAERLGVGEEAVSKRLQRARHRIQTLIESESRPTYPD